MSGLHTYHFPFLSSEIKIEFLRNIDSDIALGLSTLIDVYKNDLNSQSHNTSAFKLNESNTNFPVIVSPEFFEFFEISLKYFLATKSDFNPFSIKVDKFNFQEIVKFDKQELAIIKLKKFKFNSNLKKFFLLKKVTEFFKLNNIEDYHFNYVDIAASFGKVTWRTNFNIQELNKSIVVKLHNTFAYMFEPNLDKEEKQYAKFANLDKRIEPLQIVLKGKNLLDLKILSLEMENLTWLHQYKIFAEENNIGLTILTQDNELVEI
jgi:hypothetical protein